MKKLMILAMALFVMFAGCDGDNTKDNDKEDNNKSNNETSTKTKLRIKNESSYDIIDALWQNISFTDITNDVDKFPGTWLSSQGDVEFVIAKSNTQGGTWTLNVGSLYNGTWKLDTGDTIELTPLSGGKWNAMFINNKIIINFISGKPQSFDDAIELKNSKLNNVIKTGNNVTKDVDVSSGYIFFKMYPWGLNVYAPPNLGGYLLLNIRTNELVISEKDEVVDFVFTNNTIVVDADDSSNTGTLSSIIDAYKDPIKDHGDGEKK